MGIKAEDVFNPKDFQSITLEITMKNLTTQTEIKKPGLISLVELDEKKVTLQFPAKSCNVKHNIFVDIRKKDSDSAHCKDLCSFTGKVLEAESVGDNALRTVVDVIQVDEQSWQNLLNLFAARQEQISQFLKSVRG